MSDPSNPTLEYMEQISILKKRIHELERLEADFQACRRLLFESSPDGIVIIDPVTARCLDFNETAHRQLGYSREEFAVLSIPDFEAVESREEILKHIATVMREGRDDFETLHRTKEGRIRNVHVTAQLSEISGQAVYHCVWRDITDRKQAEEAMKRSENRLSSIIEFLPDATFVIDLERKVVAWNKAIEEMTGMKKEEIVGKGDYAYSIPFYGEPRPIVIDLVFEKDEEKVKMYDYVEKQGDILLAEAYVPGAYQGKGAYLSGRASPLFDPEGNVAGAIESIRDITEQKHIEKELQESEERYRTAIENSNDGIGMIREERFFYVNKRFLQVFGFDDIDRVVGQHVGFIAHPDDRDRIVDIHRRRERNDEAPQNYEFKAVKTNGNAIFVEVSAATTTYKGNPIVLAYVRDITGRKYLETQLRQSQKMEAIGTLAGGIAHDLNNILTVLMGYGSLLDTELEGDNPLRMYVDQILSSVRKAAGLTQSLLTFSRQQPVVLSPIRLNDIIRKTEKLLIRLLTEDISLKTVLTSDDMTIMADVTQIDQILFNLASNARDAMPKGGILTIETKPIEIGGELIESLDCKEPGEYASLSVTDTGIGMDSKTREMIFDPFFTTKEAGKGTGLGLSTVYGIVKQHNGYIDVHSEPARGTTFTIYLPLVKTIVHEEASALPAAKGGVETVLVAEDNEEVRNLLRQILTRYGYTVIEAVDGEEAVAKFQQFKNIDILVVDSVMPKKNGKEVYDEIRKIKSEIKILFTSGHARDVVLDKGVEDVTFDFISKPIRPGDLLNKVREILDK